MAYHKKTFEDYSDLEVLYSDIATWKAQNPDISIVSESINYDEVLKTYSAVIIYTNGGI